LQGTGRFARCRVTDAERLVYLAHFGLDEAPFRITPHTDFFFAGANRGATLEALLYAITHDEGIVKLTGEVGSGKTMLCRVLIERLPGNVETIFLASPSLSRDEILHALADDLHISLPGARTTVLLRALQEHLIKVYAEGRRVVLLVDEAHAMPAESLEEVRLLSNLESSREKLLQIVLFGQPELDERLARADMRQLRERITHSFKLQPLAHADIEKYVDFRLRQAGYRGANLFAPEALAVIARTSGGLTRRINILADKALLAAYADGANQVSAEHARAAVKDSEFAEPATPQPKTNWVVPAALAAGLAVGAGAHWLLTRTNAQPTAPVAAAGSAGQAALPPAPQASEPARNTAARETTDIVPGAVPAHSNAARTPAPDAGGVARVNADVMPTALSNAAASQKVDPARPASPDSASADAASATSAPAALGRLSRDRYVATQSWLQTTPRGRQSIQLAIFTGGESGRMENFLREVMGVLNPADVYVYSVRVDGRQHFRVAYGSFASTNEVQAALDALPPALKAGSPFQRSVGEMRRLNRAS
jgi:type II secretory pathway predicted ATPase ExeA/septal ring-binding cell division protein DamX